MRHLIVIRRNPIASPRTLALPVALSLLVLALSACGPGETCTTMVTLQGPGISPVLTVKSYPLVIGSILPYLDASGARHALLLGPGTEVAFTASGQASESTFAPTCGGVADWSSDHRYLACGSGIYTLRFAPDGAVTATWTGADLTLWPPPYTYSPNYVSDEWLPGSRVLTLVRSVNYQTSDGCSIDFYVLDRTASHVSLSGRLFPQEAGSACDVLQAVWSPDGQYLALLKATSVQVLPRSALPVALFALNSRPVTATVTPRTLASGFTEATWIAWRPNTRAVTVADGTTIQQVKVPDGQRTTLLKGMSQWQNSGAVIGPFAWWPDGHHLLFAYGIAQGAEWALDASSPAPINMAAVLRLAQPATALSAENTSCGLPPPVLYQDLIA